MDRGRAQRGGGIGRGKRGQRGRERGERGEREQRGKGRGGQGEKMKVKRRGRLEQFTLISL